MVIHATGLASGLRLCLPTCIQPRELFWLANLLRRNTDIWGAHDERLHAEGPMVEGASTSTTMLCPRFAASMLLGFATFGEHAEGVILNNYEACLVGSIRL